MSFNEQALLNSIIDCRAELDTANKHEIKAVLKYAQDISEDYAVDAGIRHTYKLMAKLLKAQLKRFA